MFKIRNLIAITHLLMLKLINNNKYFVIVEIKIVIVNIAHVNKQAKCVTFNFANVRAVKT